MRDRTDEAHLVSASKRLPPVQLGAGQQILAAVSLSRGKAVIQSRVDPRLQARSNLGKIDFGEPRLELHSWSRSVSGTPAQKRGSEMMARTYVVADIHGRADLLELAIRLSEEHAGPQGGTFICLGDFIDRGPASKLVIERLKAGPRSPAWRWVVLQGNHEAAMLDVMRDPALLDWWCSNGGEETLRSYGYSYAHGQPQSVRFPSEDLDWLSSLPSWFEDRHRIYVHAGVPLGTHVAEAATETLQWMCYAPVDPAKERHISGKHIVHGHDQSPTHPLMETGRTNLDTHAWATGRLVVGVFDDEVPGGPLWLLNALGHPLR